VSEAEGAVRYERRGHTAHITFDRPPARNALTEAMYAQLEHSLDRVSREADVRVAVLRGADGTFVAGTDIERFRSFRTGDDGLRYERRIEDVVARLEALAIPTVAVVEGVAAGAGLVLAAACDLRVCTPDTRFGAPIARTVGNALSIANTARLVAHLGVARTKRLLLMADFLDGVEAHAAGFVTAVVAPAELDARVDALCERIGSHAPVTMRVSREAIRRITAAVPDGDDLMRRVYESDDFREGVAAFLAKRPPRWSGR
jgi:enoyl-CoA hydratase/carnithine racemase